MKIKKIMEMFKKGKNVILFDVEPFQWISNGVACYQLVGLPRFTEQTLRAAYEMDNSVMVNIQTEPPKNVSFEDTEMSDNMVLPNKVQLNPFAQASIALNTQAGMTFIKREYVDVLDIDDGNREATLCERVSEDGTLYIVEKRGMNIEAVIVPLTLPNEEYMELLEEAVQLLRVTINGGTE